MFKKLILMMKNFYKLKKAKRKAKKLDNFIYK